MSEESHRPPEGDDGKLKRENKRDAKPYLDMIIQAEKVFEQYQECCDNIDKHHANLERLRSNTRDRQFQIFWANLETLKMAIYARPPVPVVMPRHKIRKALPRTASEFIERCLITNGDLEKNHKVYKQVRDDLALHARGVPWVTLKRKRNGRQIACTSFINRKDFLHEPARIWSEVGWVAKRAWLSAKKGKKRFGKAWKGVTYKTKDTDTADDYKVQKKVAVWEIWSKEENKVIWVSPNVDHVLDEVDPFLDLEDFYPCPEPAYSTIEADSLVPVPDFLFYRDQLEEINELTGRISALCEALRLKGFYPAGAESVSKAIETAIKSNDNRAIMVPIPNIQALIQGGGDPIIWLPIDQVATVLRELLLQRKQLIEDVYEITGISDIMRGTTTASETATAQQLKSQYGNVRVRGRQEEMERICRDCIAIEGEIMAEEIEPEELIKMAQMELPTDDQIQQQAEPLLKQVGQLKMAADQAQGDEQSMQMIEQQGAQLMQQLEKLQSTVTVDQVIKFLREEKLRPFVLSIETDSTIQADEDAEKARRTEFVTALGGMLTQAMELVAAEPASAKFVGEVIKFGTAPFRVGRALEGDIDDFVEQLQQRASQPQPNPAAEAEKAKAEAETAKLQQDAQIRQQEADAKMKEAQARLAEINAKAKADAAKHAQEMEALTAKAASEAQQSEIKLQQMEAAHAIQVEQMAEKHQAEMDRIAASAAAAERAADAKAQSMQGNGLAHAD